ncbi:hypothetical protein BCR39DRAFT_512427 [Naematelia encephala]|uniref:Nascent polypeptide-associated complex subunit alpha-like UBA domain-containing protein n=1 Tax=Naematelia encephala TaxID=71784 RepID=A0A1Y2BMK1_9TREE|nr:hypothetical protein BCR39DRAFT_512427 [Naematelia encephala]
MAQAQQAASSSGRVPQGEVIMDFADGGSYIKHRLENAVLELERRRIEKEKAQNAAKAVEALDLSNGNSSVKPQDVDFVIAQLGIKRDEAQKALQEENGDLVKTLIKLVKPRPRAKSLNGKS